jgi:hypothetical protein
MAIELEKDSAGCERDALVPILKRMVPSEGVRVGRRELKDIGLPMGEMIHGTPESGLETALVGNACPAAMLGEEPLMEGENGRF